MRYTKGAKQRGERYVWRCPAPEPMRFENCERFEELLRRTKNCAEAMGKMSTSVGLEVRVAAALLAGENSYANGVEHDQIANKIRRLLVRPVIEPSLISYWQYLSAANLDAERIAAYLQMVSGESVTKRPSPSFSIVPSGIVVFETTEESEKWVAKIKIAAADPKLRTALPIYAYVQTIMSHPFADGNGRLARSILLASLGVLCGFRYPMLALAPAFYMHSESLNTAFTRLTNTGDWTDCYTQILQTLDLAASMTENLIDIAESGPRSHVRVRFQNAM